MVTQHEWESHLAWYSSARIVLSLAIIAASLKNKTLKNPLVSGALVLFMCDSIDFIPGRMHPDITPEQMILYQRIDKATDVFIAWLTLARFSQHPFIHVRFPLLASCLAYRTVGASLFSAGITPEETLLLFPNFFDFFFMVAAYGSTNPNHYAFAAVAKCIQETWLHVYKMNKRD